MLDSISRGIFLISTGQFPEACFVPLGLDTP